MQIHIVQSGETLYSIAELYGVEPSVLAFNNDVANPYRLPVGQPIAIVVPTVVHVVQSGETLNSIAALYGVTLNDLYRLNLFLNGSSEISIGQTLYIEVERDFLGSYATGGYAYPFVSQTLLCRALPFMGALMPFTYGFRPDGSLIFPDDDLMIATAKEYGTEPIMHLSTLTEDDVFSVELAESLFASSETQRVLLDSVIANMQNKGYTSLDVDFEFLGKENATKYAEFIAYCRERLRPYGFGVMTALAPKTSDDQQGALYEGHDYALLGEAADAVLLMTYEWGYTYGPPMAVSPIKPVREVVDYALTRIPAEKILLGISNYGYDFTLPYVQGVSRATSVSTKRAFTIASEQGAEIFFDETVLAPYFDYTVDGVSHRVWFEDVRSISSRLRLMVEKGLRGALWWNLNRENNQSLVAINNLIDTKRLDLFSSSTQI
ncbi:MAG: LysM peptidoglycan-binding domain-containing protein [Clostridia bacterium]|nr:LysM peptidoglycan-binding domain-containing protein [Clostridia bacterium]